MLIRVHPVKTDDLDQPHEDPFENVKVRVWLSGPAGSSTGLETQQENAGEDFHLAQETDVEFCSGVMTQAAGGVISASCNEKSEGEITVYASTDDLDENGVGLLGTVIGITKAPAEPGWYTVMVETDDARFNAPGQRKWRVGWKFAVLGGRFLDEEMREIEKEVLVGSQRTINLEMTVPSSLEHLPVTVKFRDSDGNVSSSNCELTKIGTTHLGVSQFCGPVNLTTPRESAPGAVVVTKRGTLSAEIYSQQMAEKTAAEIWVEIEAVLDKDDHDVTGTVLDVKTQAPYSIRYRVKGTEMFLEHDETNVTVTIDPNDDPDGVRADFYGDLYTPVSVVNDQYPDVLVNKLYETAWDGRDDTSASRILLAGGYEFNLRVSFEGIDDWAVSGYPKLEIASPHTNNYGVFYWRTLPGNDFSPYSQYAAENQTLLSDQTSFSVGSYSDPQFSTATEAIEHLVSDDAVFSFGGHGYAAGPMLVFYSEDEFEENIFNESAIASSPGAITGNLDFDLEYVSDLQPEALDDVFLAVLLACGNGTDDLGESLPFQLVQHGVDYVIASNYGLYRPLSESWARSFWLCISGNDPLFIGEETIGSCTRYAVNRALDEHSDEDLTDTQINSLEQLMPFYLESTEDPDHVFLMPSRYGKKMN